MHLFTAFWFSVLIPACTLASDLGLSSQWSGWGANVLNNRWSNSRSAINSFNAGSLKESCLLKYDIGVSAPPAISGDIAYFPTWNGRFVALDYKSCHVRWDINVSNIITEFAPMTTLQTAYTQAVSRSTPQLDGSVLYFTTLAHALLVAVDLQTGALLAVAQINSHELATLTMSPTFYKGRIFVGSSSQEEAAAGFTPGYPCCSFVGNMVAVEFDKSRLQFEVVWNVRMIPPMFAGWSGVGVWGSQPSIDESRSQVFVATGNVYTAPSEYTSCLQGPESNSTHVNQTCLPDGILQEAVIALDIDTGSIRWLRIVSPLDAWTLACGYGAAPPNKAICPGVPGPDADFGMAPTFVHGSKWTPAGQDLVIIGQKNGILYALSAQSGAFFWSSTTSPDGIEGGNIWGIAVDDERAFFTAVNSNLETWLLQPSNQTIDNSAFGAVSLLDGSILWETQSPFDSISFVQPSVVNDVLFTGRTGQNKSGAYDLTQGGLIAINKRTGAIIKDYHLDVNFHGGIAIQNNYIMFGTGYNNFKGVGGFHVYSL